MRADGPELTPGWRSRPAATWVPLGKMRIRESPRAIQLPRNGFPWDSAGGAPACDLLRTHAHRTEIVRYSGKTGSVRPMARTTRMTQFGRRVCAAIVERSPRCSVPDRPILRVTLSPCSGASRILDPYNYSVLGTLPQSFLAATAYVQPVLDGCCKIHSYLENSDRLRF